MSQDVREERHRDGQVHPAIHPSLLQRKIIHFDMDAFYAAVEVQHDPKLRGKPLVVGGSPQSRAVVCTASYEARRFGIRSAMSCAQAQRLCPEAIFLPPDFAKYEAASAALQNIFHRYTALVEPLSLDEAYLDVTAHDRQPYAMHIAREIQEAVRDELGLSGSAGVAPNKLLAKIASDIHKPAGLTVLRPQQVLSFLADLPLRKIHGIGPATEKRLQRLGLYRCRDVWSMSPERLEELLGTTGIWLSERARGIDLRPVVAQRERKSLGREDTFPVDILEFTALEQELDRLCEELAAMLASRSLMGRCLTLKVKYADFQMRTRSRSLPYGIHEAKDLRELALTLLQDTEAGRRKVRLLGVSVSQLGAVSAACDSLARRMIEQN